MLTTSAARLTRTHQHLFFSVLDTDFLVLQMQSFDLILDTSHKNSLIAFFMAIVNVAKQVWLPFEKSDE
jgi:hypothetical protein